MPSRIYNVTVDARDPSQLARFWARALDYDITLETAEEVAIEPRDGDAQTPLVFVPVGESKVTKNRVHIDLVPHDQAAEVARLEALGAKRVDIGQGNVSWVVMADPEGNEFCVLTPRD